ncbi:hypothetical protein WICPIJ_009826 [Wickerhamomyces pijperi]|uniref:Uncharacterized protein n=1 Tax=Wickerhamomyces pijperi TaxID=599730 RepID=A0A9P8PJG9_WICPI|nr:hypothetical protein WICPIJ_009826 [Wickerhamomyces pijperi]
MDWPWSSTSSMSSVLTVDAAVSLEVIAAGPDCGVELADLPVIVSGSLILKFPKAMMMMMFCFEGRWTVVVNIE